MADIGRSTVAHSEDHLSSDYGETVDRLTNWGNWHASIPGGGTTTHPMFREVKSGYRESRGRDTAHDENEAMELDTIIATFCNDLELRLLLSRFVFEMSSRQVADKLKGVWTLRDRDINHKDVLSLTDQAIARVDMAVSVIENNRD